MLTPEAAMFVHSAFASYAYYLQNKDAHSDALAEAKESLLNGLAYKHLFFPYYTYKVASSIFYESWLIGQNIEDLKKAGEYIDIAANEAGGKIRGDYYEQASIIYFALYDHNRRNAALRRKAETYAEMAATMRAGEVEMAGAAGGAAAADTAHDG